MTRFFRYCENLVCGKKFRPETKFQKLCNECRKKIRNENFIKMINYRAGMELNNNNKGVRR